MARAGCNSGTQARQSHTRSAGLSSPVPFAELGDYRRRPRNAHSVEDGPKTPKAKVDTKTRPNESPDSASTKITNKIAGDQVIYAATSSQLAALQFARQLSSAARLISKRDRHVSLDDITDHVSSVLWRALLVLLVSSLAGVWLLYAAAWGDVCWMVPGAVTWTASGVNAVRTRWSTAAQRFQRAAAGTGAETRGRTANSPQREAETKAAAAKAAKAAAAEAKRTRTMLAQSGGLLLTGYMFCSLIYFDEVKKILNEVDKRLHLTPNGPHISERRLMKVLNNFTLAVSFLAFTSMLGSLWSVTQFVFAMHRLYSGMYVGQTDASSLCG